jgi:PAS domain S-box-containing protein
LAGNATHTFLSLDSIAQPALLVESRSGTIHAANIQAAVEFGPRISEADHASLFDLASAGDHDQIRTLAELLRLPPGESRRVLVHLTDAHSCSREVLVTGLSGIRVGRGNGLLLLISQPSYDIVDEVHKIREMALRAVVEANFAVCYEWNLRDGTCLFTGHFEDFLGISVDEVPTTMGGWLDLVHPDDVLSVIRENQRAIDAGTPYRGEYRMVRRDGSVIMVDDSGLLIEDEAHENRFMVGGLRDITEQREAQHALEERNSALRVILEQRNRDRADLERNITDNLRHLVVPTLDRLSRSLRGRPEALQLEALRSTLEELLGPLGRVLNSSESGVKTLLTRREYEIAQLVRAGKTTDEIAEALYLSGATVAYHRVNIRRKLGLGPRSPHLATYLASLADGSREDDRYARLTGPLGPQMGQPAASRAHTIER